MRRPPDGEYPLWLLALMVGLFVIALVIFARIAGAATDSWMEDAERAAYYVRWSQHDADACGQYRVACWWALYDLGFGPLTQDPRTGTTRLRSLSCLLWHESRFERWAVGRAAHAGVDRGIAQINSHYNPQVSAAQAYDPDWAIRWTARRLFRPYRETWWGWEAHCCKPALAGAAGTACRARA